RLREARCDLQHGLSRVAGGFPRQGCGDYEDLQPGGDEPAGAGAAAELRVPAGVNQRVLWRSAGPSAAGDVLGEREPDRAAGAVRGGQAIRRGADYELSAAAWRADADRADFQHVRAADAGG